MEPAPVAVARSLQSALQVVVTMHRLPPPAAAAAAAAAAAEEEEEESVSELRPAPARTLQVAVVLDG